MAEPRELSDDELLTVVAEMLERTEPVPDDLVAAAKDALTWRTVDAELAELLYDSEDDPEPVLVRGPSDTAIARLLTFAAGDLTVDVEAEGGELLGAISPPGRFDVELQSVAGPTARAESDGNGLFRLPAPPPGPARLVLRAAAGDVAVATPWVTL